ncbi:Citrinin biosynthesis cluster MFS transporter mrr1 [Penicillium cinerascens]|uniref:Citrinin biosynthesis cluster MFS transporter mrr1 n=1 Tax=Penicillium cinerascens TaxID=70096 RepID=A0A9W9NFL0_9EURO|nr:Citrinin biosynthesis cluster MFS transporter mrr1 [Penicillium cinerascens]KAJ5218947.1 Citrinin biosynthesis cluster MFS transporter mrr1 [Penicillium cinerascens]
MYDSLGPNWSGTLLGLLEVAIVPIPFVFYRYGYKIRMKCNLIQRMQEDKKKLEGKRARKGPRQGATPPNDEQKQNEAE